jgi:dUTP pyrophosphatase
MQKVAKFEIVSFSQFFNSFIDFFQIVKSDDEKIKSKIETLYKDLQKPKRATTGSAGYDFKSPVDFELKPKETIKVPTGIRCKMNEDIVLMIYPRSSLGFKYRLILDNTVGIIDSDYYNSDNEGHIFIKFTNMGDKLLNIKKGDGIAQGIFLPYFITEDDEVTASRNGGIGSTNK